MNLCSFRGGARQERLFGNQLHFTWCLSGLLAFLVGTANCIQGPITDCWAPPQLFALSGSHVVCSGHSCTHFWFRSCLHWILQCCFLDNLTEWQVNKAARVWSDHLSVVCTDPRWAGGCAGKSSGKFPRQRDVGQEFRTLG